MFGSSRTGCIMYDYSISAELLLTFFLESDDRNLCKNLIHRINFPVWLIKEHEKTLAYI